MRHTAEILMLLFILMTLPGCGIKADAVEPPQGAEEKIFPHTYPDLSNDPLPYSH